MISSENVCKRSSGDRIQSNIYVKNEKRSDAEDVYPLQRKYVRNICMCSYIYLHLLRRIQCRWIRWERRKEDTAARHDGYTMKEEKLPENNSVIRTQTNEKCFIKIYSLPPGRRLITAPTNTFWPSSRR